MVTYSYTLPSGPGSTAFRVRETPAALGLFDRWEFATSPVAAVDLELRHAATFTANGLAVSATAGGDAAAGAGSTYLVLAPADLALDHASSFLQAEQTDVAVTDPGSVVPARVDAEPTPEAHRLRAGRGRVVPHGVHHPGRALPVGLPVREVDPRPDHLAAGVDDDGHARDHAAPREATTRPTSTGSCPPRSAPRTSRCPSAPSTTAP
ncbi:hypothetical protein [Clavibacter tessellarius]|uniref:hypothetical protein n=1 Tax=Clavibacter tessellarius TaxID=31965 RepID=UPI0032448940